MVQRSAEAYFHSSDYVQSDLIQLINGEVIIGAILFLLMTIAKQKGERV